MKKRTRTTQNKMVQRSNGSYKEESWQEIEKERLWREREEIGKYSCTGLYKLEAML